MESQPQNPEFRYNPENFHPCIVNTYVMQILLGYFFNCVKNYSLNMCFFSNHGRKISFFRQLEL